MWCGHVYCTQDAVLYGVAMSTAPRMLHYEVWPCLLHPGCCTMRCGHDYCTQDAGTHRGSVSTLFTAATKRSKADDNSSLTITSSNQCE